MKKLLIIAVCVVFALGVLSSCSKDSSSSDIEKMEKAGELVIGITDYAPMNYYEGDKLVGFDTEYAERVCKELGVKAKFVEINWDQKVVELDTGKVDCLWNGTTYSEARAKEMDFSKPYVLNSIVVVVKKENADKYKTIADLGGLKIASEGGSSGADAVTDNEKYKEELKGATLIEAQSLTASLMEVNAGTADAAAIDSTLAYELVGKGAYADLVILEGMVLSEEVLAIGFRTGSDLVAKIDDITAKLDSQGFMKDLAAKYSVAYKYN